MTKSTVSSSDIDIQNDDYVIDEAGGQYSDIGFSEVAIQCNEECPDVSGSEAHCTVLSAVHSSTQTVLRR